MRRYVFVPLTDEILYEHPELIAGPVVPYKPGRPCYHWLSVELNPKDDYFQNESVPKHAGLTSSTSSSQTLVKTARGGVYPF